MTHRQKRARLWLFALFLWIILVCEQAFVPAWWRIPTPVIAGYFIALIIVGAIN